jgi:hypothetical protein
MGPASLKGLMEFQGAGTGLLLRSRNGSLPLVQSVPGVGRGAPVLPLGWGRPLLLR